MSPREDLALLSLLPSLFRAVPAPGNTQAPGPGDAGESGGAGVDPGGQGWPDLHPGSGMFRKWHSECSPQHDGGNMRVVEVTLPPAPAPPSSSQSDSSHALGRPPAAFCPQLDLLLLLPTEGLPGIAMVLSFHSHPRHRESSGLGVEEQSDWGLVPWVGEKAFPGPSLGVRALPGASREFPCPFWLQPPKLDADPFSWSY